ncbi:AfsR/SARP family transcriptional regulator [Plantactinospora sonchi]|uniref:BTAD domain-containing putative transcriptional regulator n=1 Tax=Plantactinospora sonchi TaxID=1544735 RepID=A0ABU7RZ37_9ACTN
MADENAIPLGGRKPRALLAALLVDHGRVVPVDRLIDVVWGSRPPGSARAILQTHVSALRQVVVRADPAAAIVSRAPGYLLRITDSSLDRDVFERLLAEGRAAAEADRYADALDLLRAASSLWHGEPLDGVDSDLLSGEALRLNELRLIAIEQRVDAELTLGRAALVCAELTDLVRRFPFRERLRGQLMVALTALGRRSEALAAYRTGRAALIDEMGIEPGPSLRAVHERILREDAAPGGGAGTFGDSGPDDRPDRHTTSPASATTATGTTAGGEPAAVVRGPGTGQASTSDPLDGPPPPDVAAGQAPDDHTGSAWSRLRPAQLPPAPADFTGRGEEVRRLVNTLSSASAIGTAQVHIIVGTGGVGKSTLALRIGHEVADRYPDGQLYAELRGMGDAPADPYEVLGRFLRALGMTLTAVPTTLDERTERFRTLTAGQRILVVLDDAGSERQVRPLLPSASGCAVLITSRGRLGGIAGGSTTELGVLRPGDSVELLDRIVGHGRAAAEAEAAQQIVRQCGGLPLAIRVAGARLAGRQHWPLRLLANRLADERRRLDELAVGDQEVRASIALSYHTLDTQAREGLRVLGVLGLPDFASWVLSAVLGIPEAAGEELVERLVDAQLVDLVRLDGVGQLRYRLHDLVRLFAREVAEAEDPPEQIRRRVGALGAAVVWIVDAVSRLSPSGEFVAQTRPVTPRPGLEMAIAQAMENPTGWFTEEHEALTTVVAVTAGLDLHQTSCDLASLLTVPAYPLEKRFVAWSTMHDVALGAARRGGNSYGEALLLYGLGTLRCAQDRYDESVVYLRRALEAFRRSKDRRGEAASLAALGLACRELGRFDEASHFLDQSADLVTELDDDLATGHVHRLLGTVRLAQGGYPLAHFHLRLSLDMYRRAGSRRGECLVLRNLSMWHRAHGELDRAMELADQAVAGFREIGDELLTAYAVRTLAKALTVLGRGAEVLEQLRDVLATCTRAGDRWGEAATLRALGELHLAIGRLDDADRLLRDSARIWTALGLPLNRARVLGDLARVEQARGRTAAAAVLRREIAPVFARYGARERDELHAELTAADLPRPEPAGVDDRPVELAGAPEILQSAAGDPLEKI